MGSSRGDVSSGRPDRGRDFLQSLERGLKVITAFSPDHPRMTLSEVAAVTGLTRPTARRVLLTLEALGYARSEGRTFELTPRVLDLGYAYLSSVDLAAIAQTEMEELVAQTHESCSVAVLDDTDIVYVARVPTKRIMTVSLVIGSRLPAYAASMGRVLLAGLDDHERDRVIEASELRALTPRTVTDRAALVAELDRVRQQGWAMVDQELEEGVRSIAAPLRDGHGHVVAAMNLGTHAARVDCDCLTGQLLPLLLAAAERVSGRLARR